MHLSNSFFLITVTLAERAVFAHPLAYADVSFYQSLYSRDAWANHASTLHPRNAFANSYAEAFAEFYDERKFSERSLPDPASSIFLVRRFARAKDKREEEGQSLLGK